MKLDNLIKKNKSQSAGNLTPEQITSALGGAENAERLLNLLCALETSGCLDNINFDDIVKGGV